MNDFVERLGWVLLHSLWQFAFVALLAGVIVRTMRWSSATARYVVLVGAMALMIVAPLATWWMLPSNATDSQVSRGASAPGPAMSGDASPGADAPRLAGDVDWTNERDLVLEGNRRTEGVSPLVAVESNDDSTTKGLTPPVRQEESVSWSERTRAALRPWLSWIVVIWSIGVLACSLRPLLGWHTLWRLRRIGVSPVSENVQAAMRRISERLRWRRAVSVMQSALTQVPVVVGYFQPVILLPVSLMTSLPVEQLEAVLAHELAHVRRHDFLVNLLQTLVETLGFYHPAVWWLSHRIRVEREHCCDDLVVSWLGNRIDYGRALVAIEELRGRSTLLALGAADGSLLARVRRILGVTPDRAAIRPSDRWPAAFVTLGCLLLLALGTFVSSRAETEPPPAHRAPSSERGSPEPALAPTAGLSNSDEETKATNSAKGDLQSKPRDSEVAYFQATPSPDDEQRLVEQLRKVLPEDWVLERRFGAYWIDRRRRVFGKHFRETPDVTLSFAKELDVPETPPMEGDVSSESLGPCRFGYCMAAIREDFRGEWPAIRQRIQSVLPKAGPATTQSDDDSPTAIAVAGRLLFEDGQPVVGALVGPMFRKKSPLGDDGRFKIRVAPEWSRFRIHLLEAKGWPSPQQWPRNAEHKGEVLDVMLPRTEEPVAICQVRLDRSKLRTVKLLWKGESVAARVNVHAYPSGNWLSVGEAPGSGKPNAGSRKASLNVARTLDVMLRPGETLTIPDVAPGDGTLRIVPIKSKRTLLWNLFGDERDERLEHDPAQVGSVEFRITGAVEADAQESPLGFMLSRIMPRSGFGLGSGFYNPADPYRLEFDPKTESYRVSNLQPGSYQAMLLPEGGTSSPPVMFTITAGQTEKIELPMPKPARSERPQKADEATNPANNANGDQRSIPAAGPGDKRRVDEKPQPRVAIHDVVRGVDFSKVKVLGYREAMRQTPDLHVPDPQNPDSWTRPKNVFPIPLGEHTWLKYPAGSGHFYIEHRADGSPESEQQYGPIEGDPFEVLKLEELLREQLKPRVNSVGGDPRYRLRLMFRTGDPGLIRRAWSLTEPHLARKFEDRNEQGLFARLELLEIAREALQKETAAFRMAEMLELAAQIQAAVSAAEASIDALNDSVADENYESRTYLQPKIIAKLPDVLWGKPVDGLRLGLVPRDWQPDIDWYALPADASLPTSVTAQPGQELRYQLIVENISDHEIKLSGYVVGEEMARSVEVLDQKGQPASIDSLHTTIPHFRSYWRLKPGERQMLMMPAVYFEPASPNGASKGLGYHVSAGKGRYSLRCSIRFGDLDNERHRHVPGKSEWIGKLTTGSQTVTVDAADARRGSDVTRAGRGSPDPDPTAGLLNSDEATNPKNNSTVASQSNPAAELPEIELLRKLVRGGKIDTRTINASITLVAARGATDAEFARLVLAEFEKSCEGGDRTSQSRRHLLAVLTDIFDAWSSPRWRSQLSRFNPDDLPQTVPPQVDAKFLREMLSRVIQHGYATDRSEIANVSLAVRQLHHPAGREFLREVLRDPGSDRNLAFESDPFAPNNPLQTVPQQQPKETPAPKSNSETPKASRWKDNTGGGWTDAKFVAAVGLAELGEAEGIDWLLARAQPNKFGIDTSLFSFPHIRDPRGSLLESSRLALADLFGLPAQFTETELADWWRSNRAKFTARPVTLKPLAGRGSPVAEPPAGLPNSEKESNQPNNANEDLRSNPAAGSGDPRRAQVELRTLRKPALLLPDHWIVQAVGFDNGGKELVTASNQSFITIRRWDVVGMKLLSEIKLQADKHGRAVRAGTLMFSGDRRRVVAATDEYVGIWDATTGKLLKQLPFKTKEGIYTCAIDMLDCTPDLSVIVGHRALPGRLTLSFDAHLIVWDGLSGNVLQTVIDKGATDLKAIDLSTDGKRLVTTNGGGAKIWETRTGQLLRSIPNDNRGRKHSEPDVSSQYTSHVWSVQFSPDGQQLAMGDILGVKLLDATSGKLLQQLEGPYRYSSSGSPGLVFSKDGQWIARLGTQEKVAVEKGVSPSPASKGLTPFSTATGEGAKHRYVVPIWSTRTGARLFELHTEANDAAFSDDGQRLAVAFSDMQQALAVWTLSGDAANVEQTAGPGPHSRQDRVEENGHYVGKTAAEFIDKFQPTWGDTKLGLQYGIALTKPQPQRKFRSGERVPLVAFFRNAGDKPIKFDTAPDFFGNAPKVFNAKGEPIAFENVPLLGHIPHYHETLAPGEALGPFYLSFGLGENPRPGQQHWHPYFKTPVAAQYKLTHSASINVASPKEGEPSKRDDITTGTIEFEIADNGNPAKPDPKD